MKRAMWIASALLTLGLVGCDRSSSPSSNTMPSSALPSTASGADESTANSTANNGVATRGTDAIGGIGGTGEESCPFRTEPDAITTVNVPDGAALVFETSDPQEKRELRDELSQSDWVQSAKEARAEETTQGVQLVFTTDSDVNQLRSEVRDRAEDLNGRCTMRNSSEHDMDMRKPDMGPMGPMGPMGTSGTSGQGTGSGSASGQDTDTDTDTDGTGSGQPARP